MKIAILSDIHGNVFALESVLSAVKKRGIDTLVIAGDFVGYYFWPVQVLKLLADWHMVAISGNHDRMLEAALGDKVYRQKVRKKYGSGLDIALEELDKATLKWLMTLPESLEYKTADGKILLCHGSPWGSDEYVYPDLSDASLNRYAELDVKWVVQGHTHHPMCKQIGSIVLINPGSVGQSRNRQIGAQWAMLDTTINKVTHFCEQYDFTEIVKESSKRHPDIPYLANILQRT